MLHQLMEITNFINYADTTGGTQLNLGTAENSYGWIEAREGATLRRFIIKS